MKETKDEEIKEAKTGCLVALFAIGIWAPAIIWRGYVLAIMWGWFIAPKFSAPMLTWADAAGVTMVVGFLAPSCPSKKDTESAAFQCWSLLMKSALWPALSLTFGWIVKHWL